MSTIPGDVVERGLGQRSNGRMALQSMEGPTCVLQIGMWDCKVFRVKAGGWVEDFHVFLEKLASQKSIASCDGSSSSSSSNRAAAVAAGTASLAEVLAVIAAGVAVAIAVP